MIIDCHTHIDTSSPAPFDKSFADNFKRLKAEMKQHRIDKALILPFHLKNADKKNDLYPSTTDVLRVIAGEKNFFVVGTINPTIYKKSDLALLDKQLREHQIVGVKLYPGYQPFYPNDQRCYPIYRLADKYRAPIIFHTGDTWGGHHRIKYSHPLAIDDVAVDFPGLKIIIAHMGNPWLIDCAELLYKNKNVYADISGLVADRSSLRSPYGKLLLHRTHELMVYACTARKLLFGTDWPLATIASYIDFVGQLKLKKVDRDYLLSKNAQELFGL